MTIVVYKTDLSPPARAVAMIVEVLKLNAEIRDLNLFEGEHLTPEYIEKNPLHTVPFLEDGDFQLADSHAILTYLVSKYGADKRAELYPADLRIRATVDQRLYFEATVLFVKLRSIFDSVLKEKATEVRQELVDAVKEAYGVLEKYLSKTTFVATNHVTIADISIVTTVSTINVLVPVSDEFPKLSEWFAKLREFSWYKSANEPGVQKITNLVLSSREATN